MGMGVLVVVDLPLFFERSFHLFSMSIPLKGKFRNFLKEFFSDFQNFHHHHPTSSLKNKRKRKQKQLSTHPLTNTHTAVNLASRSILE
jgi:hypothetical protein